MVASIEGVVTGKLGLASHQNAVPLLQQLTIANAGEDDLVDLVLEFKPSLPFAEAKKWHIDHLASHAALTVADRDVELREGYLAALQESMRGTIHLSLTSEGKLLAEQRLEVELLAKNQWGGGSSMPELLSVFCTPNDPAVDRILKATSDVLRRSGRPDAIDGYKACSRQRVWELASALWSAVCGQEISYALPPASFELQGQKIRTPSRIIDGRVATCLDTALLFSAALEQAGLNAVLVLTEGHAFCGVWLQPQEFSQIVIDDASAVRKRVDLQDLLLFETTLATQSPAPTFSVAIDTAKRQLTDEEFVLAVDLRRARMHKLRPLALDTHHIAAAPGGASPATKDALEAAPELPSFDVEIEATPSTPAGKLELWQRKLLDLTTRNRLLHLPDRAKAIKLICPDPAELEDILAENGKVRIVELPDLDVGGRDSSIYQTRNRENLEEEFARQCMARSEVSSRMERAQLDAALVDLYRKAKLDLEEGGSNTLFLAIGFLRWKKSEHDPRLYNAPLILLPVKLERRSALSGVKMSMLDDEPRFNLTLLELLRHDFQLHIPELSGNLPHDESGIHVTEIWNIVRHAVRDIPGFEVVTDVVLGTFSFAKYLMWRDLIDRTDQIMQNSVVRHLLEHKLGGSALQSAGQFPEPRKLDDEIHPAELFTPLPADSSQLAAVIASARGHSFVLDGPPGTGKSQTIANMIAHNLALGRRVLFVAEKMAALDVVKRRLDEKGIGEFCLELHSSKSSKLHVLNQLDRAWTTRADLTEDEWNVHAEKIKSLRDRLNQLVLVLHRTWPNGWTIHQAIGLVLRDATPATPRLAWDVTSHHDAETMASLRDAARQLELTRSVLKTDHISFQFVAATEWSNTWQDAMVSAARKVVLAIQSCDQACSRTISCTGLPIEASASAAANLLSIAKSLSGAYGVRLEFAFDPTAKSVETAAQEFIQLLDEYKSLESHLSQKYPVEAARKLDVALLKAEWSRAEGKFWILAKLVKKAVTKRLAAAAGTPGLPDIASDLPILEAMKPLIERIDGHAAVVRVIPGWDGFRSNTNQMSQVLRLAESIRSSIAASSTSPEHMLQLTHELKKLLLDGNDLLAPQGEIALSTRVLAHAHQALLDAVHDFEISAETKIDLKSDLTALASNARAIVEHEKSLHAWCSWCRAKQAAIAVGIHQIVEAIEKDDLQGRTAVDLFEVAYARWFASRAIDEEPLLCRFLPAAHESDIDSYATAVDELGTLTANYIRTKICGKVPDKNDNAVRDGYGILKRELQKQRRHKPVRQLAQEMGEAFPALAPCMLMSPLSIAQYLPPDQELFDLVIFDEASQIAPWDAVGSIARGKQVVIAGDPRQMPPTSFFDRGSAPGEDDTEEDLESVLDECIASGIPQYSLTWHYRSRHESLITFSNHRYYDSNLITFPAATTKATTVTWRKVDGVYSRGKGRHNQVEAKAIVAEVVSRLTDQAFVATEQSIGIITLNVDQQRLIEDLLDQARRENPSIEKFFGDDLAEPVVVKNLETMQGDERDLIILGIGFGPTEPGSKTMSMNFGPLNREGGWRRLNVAATRARREMMVFTSFDPSMIDFNRTSAKAVHDLRHLVEYAERGPDALAGAIQGSVEGYESPFEQFVAEGLRSKGWQVHSQIGVSRFRIDLGVVHPDRPGDYLAGIECDGATYHSAATARDRDKVRAEVLRGLGWTLLRVWSTEWWIDQRGALDRLHRELQAELEASRTVAQLSKQAHGASAASSPTVVVPDDAPESGDAAIDSYPPVHHSTEENREPLLARPPSVSGGNSKKLTFTPADLSKIQIAVDPNMFYDLGYDRVLEELIGNVLRQEAPILDKSLVDRVARAHGFMRSGRIIKERVLLIAKRRFHFQPNVGGDGSFVWLSKDDRLRWAHYRVPAEGEQPRPVEEIAPEEIVVAAEWAVGDDPPIQLARIFGIRRLSSEARSRMQSILRAALTGN